MAADLVRLFQNTLRQVVLKNIWFTQLDAADLTSSLEMCRHLSCFHIGTCSVAGTQDRAQSDRDFMTQLLASLRGKKMQSLSVADMDVPGTLFSETFRHWPDLRAVELSRLEAFTDEEAALLLANLRSCPKLEQVISHESWISNFGVDLFASFLADHPCLRELQLDGTVCDVHVVPIVCRAVHQCRRGPVEVSLSSRIQVWANDPVGTHVEAHRCKFSLLAFSQEENMRERDGDHAILVRVAHFLI